jgi:hypothetical protein
MTLASHFLSCLQAQRAQPLWTQDDKARDSLMYQSPPRPAGSSPGNKTTVV